MTGLVQQDIGVGLDDTKCRMLLPRDPPQVISGDLKSQRLAEGGRGRNVSQGM